MPISIGHGPGPVQVGGLYAPLLPQGQRNQPWPMWSAAILGAAAQLAAATSAWPPDWPPSYDRQLTPFRITPVGGSQGQVSTRVVLLDPSDGFPRQPDRSQLLHQYRVGYQTVGQGYLLWPPPKALTVEAEGFTSPPIPQTPLYGRTTAVTPTAGVPWYLWQNGRAVFQEDAPLPVSDYSLHRFRTTYQTVGQSYRLWQFYRPPTLEAESFDRHPIPDLHIYRVGYQSVGQPFIALSTPAGVRIDPEQVSAASISYAPFFPTVISPPPSPQPWNVYLWQSPVPDTAEALQWRSRDFWSDLLPFLITPTTPPVPPPVIVGGHGDEDYEYNQRKTREILKIKRRWEKEALERAVVKAETVAVEAAEKVDKVQVSLNVVLEQQAKPIRADQYERFEVRRKILLERRSQLVQEALEKQERLAQAQEELAVEKARIELEERQGVESLMALMMVEDDLVTYTTEEEAAQALLLWLMRDA